MDYKTSLENFVKLIEDGNIVESLTKILHLKETGDADFDCCAYYSISILIFLIQKHDPFLGDDFNEKNTKIFYKNNGMSILIDIILGKRYSFVENIKNLMLLRSLSIYEPIIGDLIKSECLSNIIEVFNHTEKYIMNSFEKHGLKDNQKILLSMGIFKKNV
jgi:hypothetical protein